MRNRVWQKLLCNDKLPHEKSQAFKNIHTHAARERERGEMTTKNTNGKSKYFSQRTWNCIPVLVAIRMTSLKGHCKRVMLRLKVFVTFLANFLARRRPWCCCTGADGRAFFLFCVWRAKNLSPERELHTDKAEKTWITTLQDSLFLRRTIFLTLATVQKPSPIASNAS